jgi:hypothetical protein
MSTLTVSTISNGSVSTSSTNVIQGSAKAWVNFNGTGTVAIRDSYNVSSITDGGTGIYTINFTTAMPNANYSVVGNTNSETGDSNRPVVLCYIESNSSTSGAQVRTVGVFNNNTRVDVSCCTVSVFSS